MVSLYTPGSAVRGIRKTTVNISVGILPALHSRHGCLTEEPGCAGTLRALVEAGKPKMCALGAAMRKLVHICYGVYKNEQPYQPQVSPT